MVDERILSQTGFNILIYKELREVLMAFKRVGIDVIVFKGAALAETVYKHIGMRKMSDVDLLVRRDDLTPARKILDESGYALKQGSQLFYTKYGFFPVSIDLHSKIFSFLSKKIRKQVIDMVWEDAVPAEITGVKVLVMAPEDTLIYSVAHMTVSHGMIMDKWLKDIDSVINHYCSSIDWNKFIRRCRICSLEIPVYYTLQLVCERLGTPVPKEVLEQLKPSGSKFLLKKIFKTVIYQKKMIFLVDYLMPILVCKGLNNKLKLISAYFFPPKESLSIRYDIADSRMYFLYYLIRPFTLIGKGLTGLGNLVLTQILHS
jgi:hypothetical protein